MIVNNMVCVIKFSYNYLFIISFFIFNIDKTKCLKRLVNISVPAAVDLQDDQVTLDCTYNLGEEELYAVKWYKDEEEFYRYVPRDSRTLSFSVIGIQVKLSDNNTDPECNLKHCPVTITNLSRLTEGSFRCEVSTEAPTFRLFFDQANMSIVAFPRGNVNIDTIRTEYEDGDEIRVNCTSPPSYPPPRIQWYINDRLLDPRLILTQSDSVPDDKNLITRSLSARLTATKELFLEHNGLVELRCIVKAPTQKPLDATVYLTMMELRMQKFANWISSAGTNSKILPSTTRFSLILIPILSFYTIC